MLVMKFLIMIVNRTSKFDPAEIQIYRKQCFECDCIIVHCKRNAYHTHFLPLPLQPRVVHLIGDEMGSCLYAL